MEIWLIWVIVGAILLILEILLPIMFLLSLGIGAFAAAIIAFVGLGFIWQAVIFAIFAIVLITFVRPMLYSSSKDDMNVNKYKGQKAKVITEIDNKLETGRIRVFDEEWHARSVSNDVIAVDKVVEIEKIEDMIAFVREINQ